MIIVLVMSGSDESNFVVKFLSDGFRDFVSVVILLVVVVIIYGDLWWCC